MNKVPLKKYGAVFLDYYISKDGSQLLKKTFVGCKTGTKPLKTLYLQGAEGI